jgi:hypothetical protein
VTTGPGTGRVSTSETIRGLLAAMGTTRTPAPPESAVTIGTTAKRIHTWEITVRGDDPGECARRAKLIDADLSAKYAHELDSDTLGSQLAASIVQDKK